MSGRSFRPPLADTLWSYPAGQAAQTAAFEFIATDGASLYIGDPGRHTISAIDARTGQLRWRTPDGGDTSAVVAPTVLTGRRSGGVLAFDADRRTVVAFDTSGRVHRRTRLPDVDAVQGICELPDSSLLVAASGSTADLLHIARTGAPLGVRPLPWPDLRTKSPLVTSALLSPTPDGCATALILGRGFARYRSGTFGPVGTYVERVELPEVRRVEQKRPDGYVISTSLTEHTIAAQDLATAGEDVFIAFGGRSPDEAHLVDWYTAAGAYVASFRTATRVQALAATDSALFVLTRRSGQPVVVALRRPARDVTVAGR